MSNYTIPKKHHITFESIKHQDSQGNEYWLARQLSQILDYSQFRHFMPVLEKAKLACMNSSQNCADHIEGILTMVEIGSGVTREVSDFRLSRYACYLIVQNADPSKEVVAQGQTYFAIQTRSQELSDQATFAKATEDERRLVLRNELSKHNKSLTAAAKDVGVATHLDYAIFQDHGYRGLYGGLSAKDIHARKQLKKY